MENNQTIENNPKVAAYALNLCTVSISQIIDYHDVNILEQEYENILNNLNLQNIPKDEALLKILKQILDTITFFRMQEGDKKMQEKRYQRKMKDAIWSAVPNMGLLVAGGNPITTAISLASQIGIGYMNYRKEKAQINLEKEENEWRLQRSAIEQFNGLRRELFDTAWRLADKYGFDDKYRLTETQIHRYNEILMDPHPYRRFERLNLIKGFFDAYPVFWYYLGQAANDICQQAIVNGKETLFEEYQPIALDCYRKFRNTTTDLLRVDVVRSSCCLELFDLLTRTNDDFLNNKDEAYGCIQDALRFSGRSLDVVQICAMNYLKLGELDKSAPLFRELVVEGVNKQTNSTILSAIYLKEAFSGSSRENYKKLHTDFDTLIELTDGYCPFMWPDYGKYKTIEEASKDIAIGMRYDIISHLCAKFDLIRDSSSKKLVQSIMSPSYDRLPKCFSEGDESHSRTNRNEFMGRNPQLWDNYIKHISQLNIISEIECCLNEYVNNVNCLLSRLRIDISTDLISRRLIECSDTITSFNDKINTGRLTLSDYVDFCKSVSIDSLTDQYRRLLKTELINKIENTEDLFNLVAIDDTIDTDASNNGITQTIEMSKLLYHNDEERRKIEKRNKIKQVITEFKENGNIIKNDTWQLIVEGEASFGSFMQNLPKPDDEEVRKFGIVGVVCMKDHYSKTDIRKAFYFCKNGFLICDDSGYLSHSWKYFQYYDCELDLSKDSKTITFIILLENEKLARFTYSNHDIDLCELKQLAEKIISEL